jgi:hypothetical protein
MAQKIPQRQTFASWTSPRITALYKKVGNPAVSQACGEFRAACLRGVWIDTL